MKSLNVIGAGRVGRSLAWLWEASRTFEVGDVLDGTPEGAREAVAFIGAGRAVGSLEEMRPAEVWMITTPDRKIAECAQALARAGVLRRADVVFHCSGSMTAGEIAAVVSEACTASVHPLKTFADPADAVRTFSGTFCAAEGDPAALAVLIPAFDEIGGRIMEIDARYKTVYHAASVLVCNYLTALMEAGLRCYLRAGLERRTAMRIMEPLVRETLDNVFRLGPVAALTGPIARGDNPVVERHLEALEAWDPPIAAIYRELGLIASELAREHGEVEADALARIEALLKRDG